MDAIDQGRAIINITKSLKAYVESPEIVRYLSATRIAGRAGIFASSIRNNSRITSGISPSRLEVLLSEACIDRVVFNYYISPWLSRNALAYFDKNEDGQEILISNILTYDAMLEAVVELYRQVEGKSDVGYAIQLLVNIASEIPTLKSDIKHRIAKETSEETASIAIDISDAHKLVNRCNPYGIGDEIYFSDRVWKTSIEKSAKAISKLPKEERVILEYFVNEVKEYQGYPESLLRKKAKENNAEHILDLAIGIELISRTGVINNNRTKRFLITPHFYSDLEDQFGEDVCDRVKIFLDSIRNGQHFSNSSRGRILDPSVLLSALLNRGSIGPCTAIGEDYTMAEKAGIISIKRSNFKPGQSNMFPIQKDVISKTLEVIDRKVIAPSVHELTTDSYADQGYFISSPEIRAKFGELPGEMREAEQDLLNALREN